MNNKSVIAPPLHLAWYVDRKSIEAPIAGIPNLTGLPDVPVRGAQSTRRKTTPVIGACGDLGFRRATLPSRSTQPARESVHELYHKSYLAPTQQDVPMTTVKFPDLIKDEERRLHATSFAPALPETRRASAFTGDVGASTRQEHFRVVSRFAR